MPGLASGAAQTTLPWSWYSERELLRQEQKRDVDDICLHELAVETWGPLVFVSPAPDARPLVETLGRLPELVADGGVDLDRLRFRHRSESELACNWKIAIENYLECYHCPVAHPGFSAVVDISPEAYRLETHDGSSSQFGPLRPGLEEGEVPEGSPTGSGR